MFPKHLNVALSFTKCNIIIHDGQLVRVEQYLCVSNPSIYQNQPERNIIHLANYPYCPKRQNGLQSCTRCQLNFNYLVTRQSNINSFKQSALVYLDLYVLIRSYIERTAEDE